MKDGIPSTTELHAFVDNELNEDQRLQVELALNSDPTLQAEVDAIRTLKSELSNAFLHIPDSTTPVAMLQMSGVSEVEVAQTDKATELPAQKTSWKAPYWAAAACLVLGVVGGYLLGQSSNKSSTTKGWIAQVVNYQDMYSTDTLEHVVSTQEAQEQSLLRLSSALGHDVVIPEFSEESIEFKRGQVLTSQQQTVIQLAYLDTASGTPIALCITPNQKAAKNFVDGNLFGVNYVNWSSDELDFLVVGNISHEQLNALARDAKLQFSKS